MEHNATWLTVMLGAVTILVASLVKVLEELLRRYLPQSRSEKAQAERDKADKQQQEQQERDEQYADELEERNEKLQTRVDTLESTVERLRGELDSARTRAGQAELKLSQADYERNQAVQRLADAAKQDTTSGQFIRLIEDQQQYATLAAKQQQSCEDRIERQRKSYEQEITDKDKLLKHWQDRAANAEMRVAELDYQAKRKEP